MMLVANPPALQQMLNRIEVALEDVALEESDIVRGTSGIALFYAYLYKITNSEAHYNTLTSYLEKTFDIISANEYPDPTFGYGHSGIGWMLHELYELELIDTAFLESIDIDSWDTFIADSLATDAQHKNYDFFMGIVGKGIYFLKRYRYNKVPEYLYRVIDTLESIMSEHSGFHYFLRHYVENGAPKKEINFGIAHGMPSIISFLLMVYETGVRKEQVGRMLVQLCSFMMNSAINRNGAFMYTYSDVFYKDHPQVLPIRHGWCYGDLGIALILIGVGKALGEQRYYDFGLDMARQTAGRRDIRECQIADACMCHGSGGLAVMYDRAFSLTQDPGFDEAATFWFDISAKLCNHAGGVGGYLFWKSDEDNKYSFEEEYSFLEGAAGAGIALLTRLHPDISGKFNWGDLLLLPGRF